MAKKSSPTGGSSFFTTVLEVDFPELVGADECIVCTRMVTCALTAWHTDTLRAAMQICTCSGDREAVTPAAVARNCLGGRIRSVTSVPTTTAVLLQVVVHVVPRLGGRRIGA